MNKTKNALIGSLVADAVSMPVHWYYHTELLLRDYGQIVSYLAPHNPHPDSQNQIHYHQFLKAGENTLNFQLAIELYRVGIATKKYDIQYWKEHYLQFLRTPGRHNDSYIEGAHRRFLETEHGTPDHDIGGLVPVPALYASLNQNLAELQKTVQAHVHLTHQDPELLQAADALIRMLWAVGVGEDLRTTILKEGTGWISEVDIQKWQLEEDHTVVGKILSPACPIGDSFPAALYLSWKYADNFTAGVCANTMVGGDNCNRGAVVGALLGLANGIPQNWQEGLLASLST